MRFFVFALWVSVSFLNPAQAEQQNFTNVDSLQYWNRSMELRDSILRLKKKQADLQGYLYTQTVFAEMQTSLFKKGATTEDEYRTTLWKKEDAEISIAEVKFTIEALQVYEKIVTLQHQWATGEKPEVVSELVALYAEQWKKRIEEARVTLLRDEAELRLREYQYGVAEKLTPKGAMTKQEMIEIRDRRDEVVSRRELSIQRIALAQSAYEQAAGTARSYRAGDPRLP